MAFHGQIPPRHLAVQQQIQGKGKVRYTAPDRRSHPAEIPDGVQCAAGGQGFHPRGHKRAEGAPEGYDRPRRSHPPAQRNGGHIAERPRTHRRQRGFHLQERLDNQAKGIEANNSAKC